MAIGGGIAGAAIFSTLIGLLILLEEIRWKINNFFYQRELEHHRAEWRAEQQVIRLPETNRRDLCLEVGAGGRLLKLSLDEASLELWKTLAHRYNLIVAGNHKKVALAIWQEFSGLLQEVLEQVNREAEANAVMPQIRRILEEHLSSEEAKRLTNIAFHCL